MYSSCLSAHSVATSVGTDWFWPSGTSATRYVERFERARTFVWTLRLPYFVPRAVGIFAASALTSSGLGFSITLAACGRRNSIFATCFSSSRRRDSGILPGPYQSYPRVKDRGARGERIEARSDVSSTSEP